MLPVFAWWVVIQIFGLAALPLTLRLLRWLPDRGYAFAKAAGLLLVAYLLWWGAGAGIWLNTPAGVTLAWLIVAGISAWTLLARGWNNAKAEARGYWQENKAHILIIEALFLLTFAGWAVLRASFPDKIIPAGGEKYMEIAFLNGVLNSPRFPPLDPWLAGYAISYYYFGYVMMGVMVQATAVSPTIGFDLYDALIFALTAVCAYGVVANLVRAPNRSIRAGSLYKAGSLYIAGNLQNAGSCQRTAKAEQTAGSWRSAAAAGLLAALFVTSLGNQEGWIHALYSAGRLPQSMVNRISIPGLSTDPKSGSLYPPNWFWWRASRILDDRDLFNQPLVNQPINEFPFFSFLLGDNHPHKMALPFVLLAIGLAFNLLLRQVSEEEPGAEAQPGGWRARAARWASWREDLGLYLFYATVLGGLAFLNTWDFPIYLALCLLAFALGESIRRGAFTMTVIWRTLALGAGLGISAIILYLFFYLSFSSQAGGVLPNVFLPTRLPQYLIQFAPFIFILAFLLVLSARRTSARGFPWSAALRVWLWIVGVAYGLYLLALLAGGMIVQVLSQQGRSLGFLTSWMGDLSVSQAIGRVLLSRVTDPWLFLLLSGMLALAATGLLRAIHLHTNGGDACSPALLFALLLAFAGLGLTLVVEFFYLRDNFGVRLNTVFKFYFQGWVLMACASAYTVWWVLSRAGRWTRAAFTGGAALLLAGGLVYPLLAIPNRAEGFRYPPTLDAAATFAGTIPDRWAAHPDDWAAVEWLRKNVTVGRNGEAPTILEAIGNDYDTLGRISAFTGFPTLLGWSGHETQWRGNDREEKRREPDIRTIYTTPTASTALGLLHQWNVRFLILGEAERQYIAGVCASKETPCNPKRAIDKFSQVLRPVFSQGSITVFSVP